MSALLSALPHSAAVHIPLALAVLFPIFYAAAWWTVKRRMMPERLWLALCALAALQLATIGTALLSGENAEFLSSGSQSQIERHEQLATIFAVTWLFVFGALSFGVWKTKLKSPAFHVGMLCILVGQLILAIWLGHIGGGLLR